MQPRQRWWRARQVPLRLSKAFYKEVETRENSFTGPGFRALLDGAQKISPVGFDCPNGCLCGRRRYRDTEAVAFDFVKYLSPLSRAPLSRAPLCTSGFGQNGP